MSTTTNQLTVDDRVLQVLQQAKGPTEIRDCDGNVFGVYTPTRITEEEARRIFDLEKARETLRREGGQGRPLKEIWKRLGVKGEE